MAPSAESAPVRRIVLFDGVCSVCDQAVHFIVDRDAQRRFEFAPLQSPAGQTLAARYGVSASPDSIKTMALIEGDAVYTYSTAALRIARQLEGGWPLLYLLRVVPRPLRDAAYRVFAANRYRWFGKLDHCRVPTPDLRSRFLDLQAPATEST